MSSEQYFDMSKPLFEEIIDGMKKEDPETALRACQDARHYLAMKDNSLKDVFIEVGGVPYLAKCLLSSNTTLQAEAAWVAATLSSGTSEHITSLVDNHCILLLINLISPNFHLCEPALWALQNIASRGPKLRDVLLDAGIVSKLIFILFQCTNCKYWLSAILGTISKLCTNYTSPPNFETVKPFIPVLKKVLYCKDPDIISYGCLSLAYLSKGSVERVNAVVESGVVPILVSHLGSVYGRILKPALRTIENIVSGNDSHKHSVIRSRALIALRRLLNDDIKHNKIDVTRVISQLASGSPDHIQALIEADLLEPLLLISRLCKGDVKKEASRAIQFVISGGTLDQTKFLSVKMLQLITLEL